MVTTVTLRCWKDADLVRNKLTRCKVNTEYEGISFYPHESQGLTSGLNGVGGKNMHNTFLCLCYSNLCKTLLQVVDVRNTQTTVLFFSKSMKTFYTVAA